jgi:PadR family transcriptional regulator, regulatory protein PadR
MAQKTSGNLKLLDQQVLLAVMRLHPDAYGISIQDQLAKAGREVSFGAIYSALDRLEQGRFVEARQGEPTAERGGRRKLYFTITALGQSALSQSLAVTAALRKGIRWKEAPA